MAGSVPGEGRSRPGARPVPRGPARPGLLLGLVMACAGPEPGPVDRDAPPDPSADTAPPADPAVDPADDTAPPPADDTLDSGTPTAQDTAPPPPAPPTDLGPGFVELLGPVWADAASPYWIHQGLPTAPGEEDPSMTWAVAGDLFDDGLLDVYAAGVVVGPVDTADHRGQWFHLTDPAQGTLVADDALTVALRADAVGPHLGLVDLDGDGDTDLLRGGHEKTFGLVDPDDTAITWVSPTLPPDREFYTGLQSATLVDIDLDGWLDVVFGADDCSHSPHALAVPMVRVGPAAWRAMPELLTHDPGGDAYAVMAAPLMHDHEPHLLVMGRGCSHLDGPTGFQRITARDAAGWPQWSPVDPIPADAAFRLDPTTAGAPLSAKQPMGSTVVDLDLDGHLDVSVSLSWEHQAMFYGLPTGDLLEDRTLDVDLVHPAGGHGLPQLPWSVVPFDADLDGWPDLLISHGDDFGALDDVPLNGPYPIRLRWNDGQGHFPEATAPTGLDQLLGSWHQTGLVDLDGDADPDLVAGGFGSLPRVWRNDTVAPHGHRGLALDLVGTTSNHYGLGARVVLSLPDPTTHPDQTRVVGEQGAPNTVVEPTLFFGLGPHDAAEQVVVHWPSGVRQVVGPLAAGLAHTITEPVLIALSEPDRHLPADGTSTLTITVTPRDDTGQPTAATAVDIEAPWGPDGFSGPATTDDGGLTWTRTLVAPDGPTAAALGDSTVLEVTVDGTTVPIRPRVWWDPVP